MTHAESQDLLLDLAYGELDAARAAELQSHLAGCDECRREKDALDEARKLAAPLREQEEPGESLDDRILAAARAQAQLEHEGNIGQVIEVQGSVQPLGIAPARIDAHGPVAVRSAERRRPRWMVRLALGGSVAAAAALALVVSTSLQTKQARIAADKTAYEINVHPSDEVAPQPEAKQEHAVARPPPAPVALAPVAPAAPPPAREKALAKKAKDAPAVHQYLAGGSGGDAELDQARGAGASVSQSAARLEPAAPARVAAKEEAAAPAPAKAANVPTTTAPAASEPAMAPLMAARSAPAATAAPKGVTSNLTRADAQSPESLEQRAQEARHAGNYALAAGLYRRAAALRRETSDANSSLAAWDLAHAVECLAAAAQFAEAIQVRDELIAKYPSEDAAFYAAARALRDAPQAEPAAKAAEH